jgi:hypothetical protein
MGDLVFLTLVVAFFALAAAYVAGCERIVGRAPVVDETAEPAGGDDADRTTAAGVAP